MWWYFVQWNRKCSAVSLEVWAFTDRTCRCASSMTIVFQHGIMKKQSDIWNSNILVIRKQNSGLHGWNYITQTVIGHFRPKTLPYQDTSAWVPKHPKDTSALVPKCPDSSAPRHFGTRTFQHWWVDISALMRGHFGTTSERRWDSATFKDTQGHRYYIRIRGSPKVTVNVTTRYSTYDFLYSTLIQIIRLSCSSILEL